MTNQRSGISSAVQEVIDNLGKMNNWSGQHGDIVPWLLVRLAGWPAHLSLDIYDRQSPQAPRSNFQLPGSLIITMHLALTLDIKRQHYYLGIPDGNERNMLPDGNCFYHAVLNGLYQMNIVLPGISPAQPAGLIQVQQLRGLLAECARQNAEELQAFLVVPDDGRSPSPVRRPGETSQAVRLSSGAVSAKCYRCEFCKNYSTTDRTEMTRHKMRCKGKYKSSGFFSFLPFP
ncbi:hypothetical protein ACGVWS_11680 [Enterobacteriaceae bacterium LUAb1]